MKKRKRNLPAKMMAMLLAAVLAAGGAMEMTPTAVKAREESGTVLLTVDSPVITDYPEIIGCNSTTRQSVSVTATGENLNYQWQINRNDGNGFVDIPGETGAVITVNRPQAEQDGHLYRCVVSNEAGSAETGGIELVVYNFRAVRAKEKIAEALEGMTVSNDTSEADIQGMVDTVLNNAGITRVITEIRNFNNTPAEEGVAGRVTGYIYVRCSGNVWEVNIDKIIPVPHVCSLEPVQRQEPTCTAPGKESSYRCEDCGKNYEDAAGTILIADLESWGNIPALEHIEDSGEVTKPATETEEGIKTYCCQRCGSKLRTETISATGAGDPPNGEQGKIDKAVETDGKSPGTQFSTPAAELADMILTSEEKQQVQSGTDIKIILDVKDVSGSVSDGDKALIETVINASAEGDSAGTGNKFVAGQYLDIGLFKVVGENRSAISETDRKITIIIDVPESLKNTGSEKERTFAVIRVHDGQVKILEDLDDNAATITIETDRFSTYAIVYQDRQDAGSSGNSGDAGESGNEQVEQKKDVPQTGDSAPFAICIIITMLAGFTYLFLFFTKGRPGMCEAARKELIARIVKLRK